MRRTGMSVERPECPDEIDAVAVVESAVDESRQRAQLAFRCVEDKIIRSPVHPFHQPPAVGDDHRAFTPGDRGCEKAADLDILARGIIVRDRYGVVGDECRTVVAVVQEFEQLVQLCVIRTACGCGFLLHFGCGGGCPGTLRPVGSSLRFGGKCVGFGCRACHIETVFNDESGGLR